MDHQRRQWVRLMAGGAMLSAAGLGGCSQDMPAAAVAAWEAAARETDPRRFALAHAILAPHSHNLQSWLLDLSQADTVLLHCDLQRLLPETDPWSRQIMMSQGTFIELFEIAARERGYKTVVDLFPEGPFGARGPDARPVARLRLQADAATPRDPLFAQIVRRRTNRNRYDTARPVPPEAWAAMRTAAAASPAPHLAWAYGRDTAALVQHRAIAAEAWRIELTTPRTFLESLKVMRVGAREVEQHRDGLTLLDGFPIAMERLGLFDRSRAPAADSTVITSQLKDFNAKLESTPAFLWMVSEGNERATQIQAGRAYARVQLAATAAGLAMQPLSQALQEYPEMAGPYAQIHRLVGANAPGRTVQMWARVGYAAGVGPAPRRGLAAHIVRS